MATSFAKTYTVKVNFTKNDGSEITDADLQAANLRALIIKLINNVTTISEGIFEATWHSDNADGVQES